MLRTATKLRNTVTFITVVERCNMCQLNKFNNVKVWALVSTKLREVDTFQILDRCNVW